MCARKTFLSPQSFITDRSMAVLLLWFILIVNVRPLPVCLFILFRILSSWLSVRAVFI